MLTQKGTIKYTLFLIIMLSFISGCKHNKNDSENAEQPEYSQPVTLKVIQSLMTPQRTAQFKKLIEQFELDNPHIKIELATPKHETADHTILTMLEKKEKVDIVEVRDITVNQFVTLGLLQSLEKNVVDWKNYTLINSNAGLMSRDARNTVYYIPSSLYQMQLYYRKDLFDEKALQVPETWEQLFFVGKQLTRPEQGKYGFSFQGGKGAAHILSKMIQDYNGSNVNLVDSMFNLDGTTIFAGQHAAEGLLLYRKIYTQISDPKSLFWGNKEQVQAFVKGNAAMLIKDSDTIDVLKEQLHDNEWATAPLPKGPDGISYYNVGAAGWGIASHSKHKEEAWAFISYLSSYESNRAFADAAGVMSIYNNVLNDEKYSSGPYTPYGLMANDPIRYRGVKQPTDYTNYNYYFKMGTELGKSYLVNEMTTEEMLKLFDEFWQLQRRLEKG